MMGAHGIIAAIEPHPTRRRQFTLRIEGHEPLVIHEDVIVALQLRTGMAVGPELAARIAREQQVAAAREAALRLLKTRPRSRHELTEALTRKGVEEGVVEQVLAKLENMRLVDDQQYARELAGSLLRRRPCGRRALMARLQQRGISAEVAREAVSDAVEGVDEAGRAIEAVQARMARWEDLPPRERWAKAYAYLARLGFEHDTIADALNTVMGAE